MNFKMISHSFLTFTLLFSPTLFAANTNNKLLGDVLDKYNVHYSDIVYTDMTRERNGTICNSCTPTNGYRLIDVRIFRPAGSPGTGSPLRAPVEPILYNGSFANHPTVTSTIGFQLDRTWTNNAPLPGPFPLVVMFGGGGSSINAIKLAEEVASAGFIVALPSGYGVDASTCPIPSFCAAAVARTQERDARVVINAAMSGGLGFPYSEISQDSNGPIVACVGGSAGAGVCIRAAGGATMPDANSLIGEMSTDTRIRAVLAGDIYSIPAVNFNNANFKAVFGMFASGLRENWPADYALYNNASKRIFYETTNMEHRGAALDANSMCDQMRENIRVYSNSVNTLRDDASVGGVLSTLLGPDFSHCATSKLTGFSALPLVLPNNLSDLLPSTPLSGILFNDPSSTADKMINYYVINFLRAFLNGDSAAYTAATTPSFPGLLNDIYVDSVPGTTANNFNLQNKQVDIKLVSAGTQFKTTIVDGPSVIPDPSTISGATSVFGNATWDESIAHINLPFNFPFKKGNIIQNTSSIEINSNGFVLPESNLVIIDGGYEARRLQHWFADRGSTTIACLGTNLASGPVGPGSSGKIWISSTPQRVQITWYKVQSVNFPSVTLNAQCTLYPDGSVRFEYDSTIPAVLPPVTGASSSIVVGISNGRLHLNGDGKYVYEMNPRIDTLTDVLNGKSTIGADAVYEVYTRGVTAIGP